MSHSQERQPGDGYRFTHPDLPKPTILDEFSCLTRHIPVQMISLDHDDGRMKWQGGFCMRCHEFVWERDFLAHARPNDLTAMWLKAAAREVVERPRRNPYRDNRMFVPNDGSKEIRGYISY